MDKIYKNKIKLLIVNSFSSIISLSFVITFFISFHLNNFNLIYIFGPLTVANSLFNSFNVFINQEIIDKKIKKFVNYSVLIEFIISIAVIICTIYRIQNDNLKEIIIPITASILGGYLTLLGVGWTIKQSQKDKRDDYIKNNKPLLFIVNPEHHSNAQDIKLDKPNIDDKVFTGKKRYIIDDFLLENSDFSYSSLKGFIINNDFIELPIAQAFRKQSQYYLLNNNIEFNYDEKIEHVYLVLLDMLDNVYKCDLNFEIKDGKIIINSIINTIICK